jgi:hypothetical protein
MLYVLNVQPVIPIKISEDWNLITRTIMPIINQPSLFPTAGGLVHSTTGTEISAAANGVWDRRAFRSERGMTGKMDEGRVMSGKSELSKEEEIHPVLFARHL